MNTMDPTALRAAAIEYFGGRQHPFTQRELASFLGVSRYTLLRYRREGALTAFVRGNVVRFAVESVYSFIIRQTV